MKISGCLIVMCACLMTALDPVPAAAASATVTVGVNVWADDKFGIFRCGGLTETGRLVLDPKTVE